MTKRPTRRGVNDREWSEAVAFLDDIAARPSQLIEPYPSTLHVQSEMRGIIEELVQQFIEQPEENIQFARALVAAIYAAAVSPEIPAKKRAAAMHRASGLSGHRPHQFAAWAEQVAIAGAFGITEEQALREADALEILPTNSKGDPTLITEAARELRRMSNRTRVRKAPAKR